MGHRAPPGLSLPLQGERPARPWHRADAGPTPLTVALTPVPTASQRRPRPGSTCHSSLPTWAQKPACPHGCSCFLSAISLMNEK